MDSKSRSGRFDLSANKLVEDFNATIMIEQRNCPFDIKGSQAHATMLGRQGIISQEDAEAICKGWIKWLKKFATESLYSVRPMKTFTWPLKSE